MLEPTPPIPPALNLHGIIPPVVTPLVDRDEIDGPGLGRLLDHMIQGGVHGLFILGTTGEAPSLSYELRRELILRVCQYVSGQVPIWVGITDTSFVESVALAKFAVKAGADGVVLSTPYYFPAGQTELIQYVQHLAEQLPMPLVLYNMPSLTKVWFDIETLEKLAAIPNIIGVKDSSGDTEYFSRLTKLRALRPDWSCMMGPEAMLPKAIELGGQGGVNGGANVFPKLFVACYNAAVSGDAARVASLQRTIDAFQAIYEIGKYASRYIKATKCSLSLLGICDDFMAEPFNRFLAPERARVAALLEHLKTCENSELLI